MVFLRVASFLSATANYVPDYLTALASISHIIVDAAKILDLDSSNIDLTDKVYEQNYELRPEKQVEKFSDSVSGTSDTTLLNGPTIASKISLANSRQGSPLTAKNCANTTTQMKGRDAFTDSFSSS